MQAERSERADWSTLALTAGDPCGIGCEIVVRALATVPAARQPLVVGSSERLARTAALLGLPPPARIEPCGPPVDDLPWGRVDATAGAAAFAYVERAVALARSGAVSGIVTAPIAKAALAAAGYRYPGHTEILAELGGAGPAGVAMMLANDELRVVLVTIHCALAEAIRRIDTAAVLRAIEHADAALRALGVVRPRVAVCGLNPHAGEDGLFGREDIEQIAPAVAQAQARGIDASGPWPADTVFMRARGLLEPGPDASGRGLRAAGAFDVVVAQYHDQGLIPVKYLGIDQGVNITLGLPFVRTSPDHGTAFDIAGQGRASAASLVGALDYAARLGSGSAGACLQSDRA